MIGLLLIPGKVRNNPDTILYLFKPDVVHPGASIYYLKPISIVSPAIYYPTVINVGLSEDVLLLLLQDKGVYILEDVRGNKWHLNAGQQEVEYEHIRKVFCQCLW